MTQILSGLAEVADDFDLLVCDVWGVVHNGLRAWPQACDALQRFRAGGGTVVLVTNAPRPRDAVAAQLDNFGVPTDCHDAIVTSGDLSREALSTPPGKRVYHLGPDRDRGVFEGLDIVLSSLGEAEVVLNTGLFDDERETPDDYAEALAQMHERGLEMICANPDLVVERGERLVYCAGAVAERYEQIGGSVLWAGKPRAPVYERAFELATSARGEAVPRSRALAVGDSLRTDIAGGAGFGIATLFVADGIHAGEVLSDGDIAAEALSRIATAAGMHPDFATNRLCWAG